MPEYVKIFLSAALEILTIESGRRYLPTKVEVMICICIYSTPPDVFLLKIQSQFSINGKHVTSCFLDPQRNIVMTAKNFVCFKLISLIYFQA